MAKVLLRDGADHPIENDDFLERPRLDRLLAEAVKRPLVIVSAAAGYGKTRAVYRFLRQSDAITIWIQLSERDNLSDRFWENFTGTILQYDEVFAARLRKLGFPDTEVMFKKLVELSAEMFPAGRRYVIVFDDFHLLTDKTVLGFIDRVIHSRFRNLTTVLISRTEPELNFVSMLSKGLVEQISETELRFTEQETLDYLKQAGLSVSTESLQNICAGTEGWAFAVNLIARSLEKNPERPDYAQSAVKLNIYKLLETEVFAVISKKFGRFLIRLSLIEYLSADLIRSLAEDAAYLKELPQISAYMRYDAYTNAYHIHQLFRTFLTEKQGILTKAEKLATWLKAADWCEANDYKIDAITYYGKAGCYERIINIVYNLSQQLPPETAAFVLSILESAPRFALDQVVIFPAMHLRLKMSLGQYDETLALASDYIGQYESRPETPFTNRVLAGVYSACGLTRFMMSPRTDVYDMDVYLAKEDYYYSRTPYEVKGPTASQNVGPWISMVGTDRPGAMEEYIESLDRAVPHAVHAMGGCMAGMDALARAELLFYKNKIRQATPLAERALREAGAKKQYDVQNRALFNLIRIGFAQGNYSGVRRAVNALEKQLDEPNYLSRYMTYDAVRAWYYLKLGQPQAIADWFKGATEYSRLTSFSAAFMEQVQAWYLFHINRFHEALACIQAIETAPGSMTVLLGRVERKVLEAICMYRLGDRQDAFFALGEAYRLALSNELTIPFIEFGKDMRTLTRALLKDAASAEALTGGVPVPWIEDIGRKAASYAKRQAMLASEYRKEHGLDSGVNLTVREHELLSDLYHGLTRAEIAAQRGLSVNTVKSELNMLYLKLDAENSVSAIRIALKNGLL